jgi:adenosylcobinamide-GDP ribazoletransferase
VTRQARLFFCALQFLTRLPAPRHAGFEPDWIARSTPWFPVVGWIVGALSAGVLWLASRVWPMPVAAVLAVVCGLLATGGFHEDGLADTADGLGGGQTRARRLEIMKDSRLGTYGALALWASLTLKAAILASLPPAMAALSLVLAHGAARAAPVAVMAAAAYAGESSKLTPASFAARPAEAAAALAIGLGPLVLLLPLPTAAVGVGLAALAALAVALTARRLIGGFTGDVLGAVEQVAEIGLLLGFAARLAP